MIVIFAAPVDSTDAPEVSEMPAIEKLLLPGSRPCKVMSPLSDLISEPEPVTEIAVCPGMRAVVPVTVSLPCVAATEPVERIFAPLLSEIGLPPAPAVEPLLTTLTLPVPLVVRVAPFRSIAGVVKEPVLDRFAFSVRFPSTTAMLAPLASVMLRNVVSEIAPVPLVARSAVVVARLIVPVPAPFAVAVKLLFTAIDTELLIVMPAPVVNVVLSPNESPAPLAVAMAPAVALPKATELNPVAILPRSVSSRFSTPVEPLPRPMVVPPVFGRMVSAPVPEIVPASDFNTNESALETESTSINTLAPPPARTAPPVFIEKPPISNDPVPPVPKRLIAPVLCELIVDPASSTETPRLLPAPATPVIVIAPLPVDTMSEPDCTETPT